MAEKVRRNTRTPRDPSARKGIYVLPNLLTTAGLFFGFYAIVLATKGDFENAAIAVFVAMLMDGADGRVARITNTTSDFGKEYDSLVDVISFGLTPALVIYEWTLYASGKVGWLVAFTYVAATALRLARFNTQEVQDKGYFQGLPCPAAAALVAAFVWVLDSYNFRGEEISSLAMVLVVAAAMAMVSNIRYRSFKDFDLKGRIPFVKLIFLVLMFVLVSLSPPRVLFLCALVYFLSGPISTVWGYRRNAKRKTDPHSESTPPNAEPLSKSEDKEDLI
ncbi:MAG: CDP-diacylglycerol--serine O-phosphatidyltransferase [Gammaproteobacteria bacterium]|nr:CDP-diacylglycerol--serine O-phosphatidyltransferase [Gammaproteobacteria bacterium]